jgi:drug/metabolite transporter (DMT)-like permease
MTIDHIKKNFTLLGIAWVALGFTAFSFKDVVVKLLGDYKLTSTEIIIVSNFLVLILALPRKFYSLSNATKIRVNKYRNFKLQMIRAICFAGSTTVSTYFITKIPLTTFYNFAFSTPFFVLMVSAVLLKEKISHTSLIATILGFVGVYVSTIGYTTNGTEWSLLDILPLVISPILLSIGLTISRLITKDEPAINFAIYPALVVVMIYFPYLSFLTSSRCSIYSLILLTILALLQSLGSIANAKGYQLTEAYKLAAVHYIQIIWGILFGLIIWHTTPTVYELVGGALVIFSGLFLVKTQQDVNKKV